MKTRCFKQLSDMAIPESLTLWVYNRLNSRSRGATMVERIPNRKTNIAARKHVMRSAGHFFLALATSIVLNACGDGSAINDQHKTSGDLQKSDFEIIDCKENAHLFDNDHRTARTADKTENFGCGRVGARQFIYDLPEHFDPARGVPYPVIYAWHGCGSSGGGFRNIVDITARSAEPVISIYPDSDEDDNCWNVWSENKKDLMFFDALHLAVIKNFNGDENRVFSIGYSSGAHISHQLGCVRGSVVRGLVSVAGAVPDSARTNSCTLPMPVLIAHGVEDTSVNYRTHFEATLERYIATNQCESSTSSFESNAPSGITDAGITFDCRTQSCDTMLRYCSASCVKGEGNCGRERVGRSPANMAAHDFDTWIWFIQWSVEHLLNNSRLLKP